MTNGQDDRPAGPEGGAMSPTERSREAMDDLKRAEKESVVSQDEHKRLEVEVQKLTDEAVRRVDEVLKIKEQEIMQV